jgi:hypothetical protein
MHLDANSSSQNSPRRFSNFDFDLTNLSWHLPEKFQQNIPTKHF